jgi:hypothetical protein
MKTKLFFSALLSFSFYLLSSQTPQGFNYQAIARDATGNPIVKTSLPVRITIQSDSAGSVIYWQELHSSAASNGFGLVNIVVGRGARQTPSTVATFSAIDWSVTPKFIKTEIDYGGWRTMGITRLWSVPYSAVAGDLAGTVDKLDIKGTSTLPEDALFEVKNKDGQTIFGVYNEGVRIWIDDRAKGTKGGFAVGGFDMTKSIDEYFRVTRDSVRIYLDTNPDTKKSKGGFAVGGYDMTKGTVQNFLDLSPANHFIGYQAGLSNTSGQSNIFIGTQAGFKNTTSSYNVFLGHLAGYTNNASSNVFLGNESGRYNTSGSNNAFMGFKAGWSNTSGTHNVFIGTQSGYLNTTGNYNTFFGYQAGYNNNSDWNFFSGTQAGYNNTSGNYNSFIGYWTGFNNTTGSSNVFIGERAGYSNKTGNYNTIIGESAGRSHETGYSNVFIGPECGYSNIGGQYNTFLGGWTGYENEGSSNVMIGTLSGNMNINGSYNTFLGRDAGRYSTGSQNVFIGNSAGSNETGSDKLYIDNSNTTAPLIWGDFSVNQLVINGNSGNNPNSRSFFVNGTAGGNFPWNVDSDARMKKNINSITDALEKVMRLRGVNFEWNDSIRAKSGIQIGFIAQEAINVIPEVVTYNNDHYSMQYEPITALLVEAMKEQQQQIEQQEKEINKLKALVNSLIANQTAPVNN